MHAIIEGGQESGMVNLRLSIADADDAIDRVSSESKLPAIGLGFWEKDSQVSWGLTGTRFQFHWRNFDASWKCKV